MKQFLQVFLFLISVFFVNSCSNTKGLVKEKKNSAFIGKPLLQGKYSTALYKTKIDIGNKHFSGLFYFKIQTDTSYRIVFLSEFGLNLLDLEYKNHEFTVKNCKEFLNKKIIINMLQKDLRLLIDIPQNYKNKVYKNTKNKTVLIKFNKFFKKYLYFYSEQEKLYKIIKKNGISHIVAKVRYDKKEIPQEIEIDDKRINLSLKFNLIELK